MDVISLDQLAARIAPGLLVAIPPDYSGVPMAATRALVRRDAKDLRLIAVPTSGLQADVLIGASCVAELEAAAVTLGEFGLAPRFTAAIRSGTLRMRDTTCPAVHAALQASEKGVPFMPLRGLIGTDIMRNRADWKVGENPFAAGDPIVFLPAIRPDIALFHAAKADRQGNVWIGRRRELVTMAHAAERSLVTVEEIVDGSLLDDEVAAAGVIPGLYVEAIAAAPRGAWPLALPDAYPADDAEQLRYAEAARTEAGFRAWLDGFLNTRPAAA
ncbi:MAG TPA: CoA transferase [Alphaproteobacteria bacterium]